MQRCDAGGRTVLDKTGLDALAPSNPNGPSIFKAVEEQLGLKLET
jgi:hypothetical protein